MREAGGNFWACICARSGRKPDVRFTNTGVCAKQSARPKDSGRRWSPRLVSWAGESGIVGAKMGQTPGLRFKTCLIYGRASLSAPADLGRDLWDCLEGRQLALEDFCQHLANILDTAGGARFGFEGGHLDSGDAAGGDLREGLEAGMGNVER